MRAKVLVLGLVFVSLGLATYAYAVAANLQEYACSDPCTVYTSGNTTRSSCQANCPYVGVPGSSVKVAGLVVAVLGFIFLVVALIPLRKSPYIGQ